MPNIKSSIRSVKTDAERRAKNAAEKSAVRTAAKKVEAQVAEGQKAEAEVTLKKACLRSKQVFFVQKINLTISLRYRSCY